MTGRVAPRGRWAVAVVLVFVFVSVLAVEAYVNAEFAPDHGRAPRAGAYDGVPDAILNGGSIIDTRNGAARSYAIPKKTMAITFDDGPDPRWTPAIERILDKHGVKATFFVVGTQVARYPFIARDLANAGHEIAIHSFTHPDMAALPQWRQELEYAQSQLAIVSATGRKAALVRLPYSAGADAIDNANWALIKDAGRHGYLTAMTDTDSQDWSLPGVEKVIENSIPQNDDGSLLLMHDAGGDRTQTLAALDRLIPLLKARGYQFTTVSEGLNRTLSVNAGGGTAPAFNGNPAAEKGERQRGYALIAAITIADWLLYALGVLFVLVGVLTVLRTVIMFGLAFKHARTRRSKKWSWGPAVNDPVSVIVPAYNEKEGIAQAVRSLAGGDHPGGIEVIVVDDGSSDETAAIARGLGLPNVRVVSIPNGGKPNALNVGVALSKHELIVMVDGDTVFEKDAVRQLVQPFGDPNVGAVAGNVKVGNRDSIVSRWQHIEYVIGFNLDRRLYDELRCMSTIPGAIGAFRRSALVQAGGMTDDTLAEDTDVTMALGRAGWRVVYEERARAWTEAPTSLRQLWLQRYRWSYGTMQAIWKHKRSLVEKGPSGRYGRVGLPLVAVFGVALPLFAPLIDLLTIYGLVFFNWYETAFAWLAMLGLQFVTAFVAFRLDREKLRALWVLPLQQFAYRQLMYLVLIQSVVTALTGARLRWHKLRRAGTAGDAAGGALSVDPIGPPEGTSVPSASAAPAAPVSVVPPPLRGRVSGSAVARASVPVASGAPGAPVGAGGTGTGTVNPRRPAERRETADQQDPQDRWAALREPSPPPRDPAGSPTPGAPPRGTARVPGPPPPEWPPRR
jgi:cellulose synthase/poly-beta-1,6-N-acetylglucosamine synthase-like glycosyltransferase/peptidoglycan/xylan/chitin deacetylase (PgdA/CDA1 family)